MYAHNSPPNAARTRLPARARTRRVHGGRHYRCREPNRARQLRLERDGAHTKINVPCKARAPRAGPMTARTTGAAADSPGRKITSSYVNARQSARPNSVDNEYPSGPSTNPNAAAPVLSKQDGTPGTTTHKVETPKTCGGARTRRRPRARQHCTCCISQLCRCCRCGCAARRLGGRRGPSRDLAPRRRRGGHF
jgi:hypothetical protein